jgi:hypothetical protein
MNRFLPLALVLCFSLNARADDASRHAKAELMITLAHVDRLNNQVMDTIMQQTMAVATQNAGGSLTVEKRTALEAFQKKLMDVLQPQIGWKAMKPAFADLYARQFSEEQMDAIIAFYKSPAGVALMDKMPEINQEANQLMQDKIVALQPKVRQMFADFEKTQQSAAPAPAAPPTLGPAKPK